MKGLILLAIIAVLSNAHPHPKGTRFSNWCLFNYFCLLAAPLYGADAESKILDEYIVVFKKNVDRSESKSIQALASRPTYYFSFSIKSTVNVPTTSYHNNKYNTLSENVLK